MRWAKWKLKSCINSGAFFKSMLITHTNGITIKNILTTNKNRKKRKYVSTPAPKCPSISLIESYQNFESRMVFRTKCFVLIVQKPTKCSARFHRLTPVCLLFSFTISFSLILIRIRVDRSCGNERNVVLENGLNAHTKKWNWFAWKVFKVKWKDSIGIWWDRVLP